MASAAVGNETGQDAADTAMSELPSNFDAALPVIPSPEAAPAVQPTDANPATTSSNQYYSEHTQWMIDNRDKYLTRAVDFEIECSKVHRTSVQRRRRLVQEGEGSGCSSKDEDEAEETDERELDEDEYEETDERELDEIVQANRKTITELREHPDWKWRFRPDKDGVYEIREKIGQGGEAKIYAGIRTDVPVGWPGRHVVFKVFPRGYYLRDLVKLWPKDSWAGILPRGVSNVEHAMLMPNNGRIATVMRRAWGDLRRLINLKKQANHNQGPPFDLKTTLWLMRRIACNMDMLHNDNVLHRDLKASNVLLDASDDHFAAWESNVVDIELPLPKQAGDLAQVSDYECALGVMGTGFWRGPEVFLGMKDPSKKRSATTLFTKESDVYSYGMLCYEIVTGFYPFEREGFKESEGDRARVINGERPSFPDDVDCRVKDLIRSCWHRDKSQRPTFKEIFNERLYLPRSFYYDI